MAARGLGDDFDFIRIEAEQLGVFDQVIGMAVVPVVVNRVADIVQKGRKFKQFARALAAAPAPAQSRRRA